MTTGAVARDLDGIRQVPDGTTRDQIFPLATRDQNRRVFRLDTKNVERWTGSAWVVDPIDYANIANAPGVDASFANNTITTVGLTYGYNAGTAVVNGASTRIATGTIALSNNAVNYVERTYAGVVSKNTTAFGTDTIPMAKVTTVAGAITLIEDWRSPIAPPVPYPVQAVESAVTVSNTRYPEFNILRYGGVADNATNNATAFLRALTAASGRRRARIIIPAADDYFKLLSTQSIQGHNVEIICEGRINAQVTGPVFSSSGFDQVKIDGLDLSGVFGVGVKIIGGSGHRLRYGSITGATGAAVGGARCGIQLDGPSDSLIEDMTCFGNGNGIDETQFDILINHVGAEVPDITVKYCHCRSTGVFVNLGFFNAVRCLAHGNECTGAFTPVGAFGSDNGGCGILFYSGTAGVISKDSIITENHVHDVQGQGIYCQRQHGPIVAKNIVDGTGSVMLDAAPGTLPVAGIVADISPGAILHANRVRNSNKHAIAVCGDTVNNNSEGTIVSANSIDGVPGGGTIYFGVCIRGTATDVLVESNDIINAVGVPIGEWGNNGSSRINVRNNNFDTCTTYGIWARAASAGWTIAANTGTRMVDPTLLVVNQGTGNMVWGNTGNGSLVFPVDTLQSRIALSGDGAAGSQQLRFGTTNIYGGISAQLSAGDILIASNATVSADGLTWTQTLASSASTLLHVNTTTKQIEVRTAVAGKAAANFATFWGSVTGGLGQNILTLSGSQVIGTRQAAIPDIATADATDLATAITLTNANKAKINAELSMFRVMGFIAP